MLKKIVICLAFIIYFSSLVYAYDDPFKFEGSHIIDKAEILNEEAIQKMNSNLVEIYENYNTIVIIETIESINKEEGRKLVKERFFSSKLDKMGIPIYNLYILYSQRGNKIFIGKSDSCGLDLGDIQYKYSNKLDDIEKQIDQPGNAPQSTDIPQSKDFKEVLEILVELARKEILNHKPICVANPETKIKEDKCKPIFEGDRWDGKRRRILFLGSGFSSENEFRESVKSEIIERGFMGIQPFKYYSGNGINGKFQFVYGKYDLTTTYEPFFGQLFNYEKNSYDYKILSKGNKECANTFLVILVDNKWNKVLIHKYLLGYTLSGENFILAEKNAFSVIHEVGHKFGLHDEYILSSNDIKEKNYVYSQPNNCRKAPSEFERYYPEGFEFAFLGCSFEELYRSSIRSIMGYVGGLKFNMMGCMYIASVFEEKELDKVYPICKEMYDRGELEKNPSKLKSSTCEGPVAIYNDGDRGASWISVDNNEKRKIDEKKLVLDRDIFFCNKGIEIGIEDYTLDCNGHKIYGSFSKTGFSKTKEEYIFGIQAASKNIIIENCNIENFEIAIAVPPISPGLKIIDADLRKNYYSIYFWEDKKEVLADSQFILIGRQADYAGKIFAEWGHDNLKGKIFFSEEGEKNE